MGSEQEYTHCYEVLEQFIGSVRLNPNQTITDLRQRLRLRLKRERDEKRVGWIVIAYGALTLLIDSGMLAVSATVEQLEELLKWVTMLPASDFMH